jgi:hypothetical protein
MADNVHNLVQPRPDVIRDHLEHLFRRAREEYDGGRCEIAWADKDYKPTRAETFLITREGLDLATDVAVKHNLAGSNVYVGANPRKPNTSPVGRCSGLDVEIAYHQFVDADSLVASDNLRRAPLPYTWVVVTGRFPHYRPHCYWALENAIRNLDAWTDQQKSMAIYFGSDPVINRDRLMRLGGSVNYPTPKKLTLGYRVEVTTLRTEYDGEERQPVTSEALFRFYPWAASSRRPADWYDPITGEVSDRITEEQIAAERIAAHSYNLPIDKIDPEHCVREILAGVNLHLNTRDLINHLIATGHRDWLIEDYITRLLGGGKAISDGGTIALIPNMIRTWRQKTHIPDPEEEQFIPGASPGAESSPLLKPVGLLVPAARQPRQFIVPQRMMRGHITMTAAGPGVGKTTLAVEEAVSLASGIDFLGFGITQKCRVAIINNEESRDELERRIEATCKHFKVPLEAIADSLFLYSGVDAEKIIVATADRNGKVTSTVYTARLREEILSLKLDVVILDPFVQIHYVEESSNEQISRVLVQVRAMGIGDEHRAAIHIVHHTRKAPPGNSTQAGDMQAARGASSMGGEAHFFFTLTDMSDEDGEKLNIIEEERNKYIRLDDAKAKMGPAGKVRWFQRHGVIMPYGLVGEEIGVLVPRDHESLVQVVTAYKATEALTEIDRAWTAGNPYNESHTAKERYVVHMMMRVCEMTRQAAKELLASWLINGMVATQTRDTHAKLKGLKVEKWPT